VIREAFGADMPRLMDMGRKFHAASGIGAELDEGALRGFLSGLLQNDSACILVGEHGTIGGVLVPAYFNPSWVMAVEAFWWAERDGLALLREFEAWAAKNGASEVRMTSLASLPRADAVLRRKGYSPIEISYQKVI
jgi:GNAT superfamily N-acetyltransferase